MGFASVNVSWLSRRDRVLEMGFTSEDRRYWKRHLVSPKSTPQGHGVHAADKRRASAQTELVPM